MRHGPDLRDRDTPPPAGSPFLAAAAPRFAERPACRPGELCEHRRDPVRADRQGTGRRQGTTPARMHIVRRTALGRPTVTNRLCGFHVTLPGGRTGFTSHRTPVPHPGPRRRPRPARAATQPCRTPAPPAAMAFRTRFSTHLENGSRATRRNGPQHTASTRKLEVPDPLASSGTGLPARSTPPRARRLDALRGEPREATAHPCPDLPGESAMPVAALPAAATCTYAGTGIFRPGEYRESVETKPDGMYLTATRGPADQHP